MEVDNFANRSEEILKIDPHVVELDEMENQKKPIEDSVQEHANKMQSLQDAHFAQERQNYESQVSDIRTQSGCATEEN